MSDENKIYEVQHLPSDGSDSTTTIWIKNHGINKISYANCDTFEGKHNENKVKEGSGVYVWMNRTTNEDGYEVTKEEARYEGDYSNGVRHGYGKIVFPNKDTYEGSFKDGKMHGDGTYVYAFSNDIYSGSWSEGKRHGQGLYEFSKDKSVLKGTWKLGEFEEGDWVMTNHITYSGKFRNGKPIGTGKFAIGHASSVSGKHMTVPVSDDGQVASIKWNSTSVLKM